MAPSSGSYRPTLHPYKLIFQLKTKIKASTSNLIPFFFKDSNLIPIYGTNPIPVANVCIHNVEYEFLVDVMGLMTGISEENEYVSDGKVTIMVVIELTDNRFDISLL